MVVDLDEVFVASIQMNLLFALVISNHERVDKGDTLAAVVVAELCVAPVLARGIPA